MSQQFKWTRYESQQVNGSRDDLTKASTAITAGRLVSKNADGYVVHAVAGDIILGIAKESKSASDATTTPILIDYVDGRTILRVTVDAGTVAQAKQGDLIDIHANGGIDVDTSTADDAYCLRTGVFPGDTEVLVTLRNTVLR